MNRPGRRSVPSLLWALTTNSAPLSSPTTGVATAKATGPVADAREPASAGPATRWARAQAAEPALGSCRHAD